MTYLPVKFRVNIHWLEDEAVTGRKVQKTISARMEFLLSLGERALIVRQSQLPTPCPPYQLQVIGSNDEVELFSRPLYDGPGSEPYGRWSYSSRESDGRLVILDA